MLSNMFEFDLEFEMSMDLVQWNIDLLNEKDFIGMCNDVTSRSIIQNKCYCFTLFKGIEHLCIFYIYFII